MPTEQLDNENPVVSVIVISYNTRQMTLDCLRDLYTDLGEMPAEVIVIDNASKDGSVDAIRDAFPSVQLIENSRNAGFGAANNIGLKMAHGEFLMLLNSDAFMHAGATQALVDFMRANPKVGAVGPRLLNKDGSVQQSCYKYPSPTRAWLENLWLTGLSDGRQGYSQWAHDSERIVDWVIGACVMVRQSAYAQAGGFDESFFMYQEETDWQRRIRDSGWQIALTPTATVTHLGGASGASEQARINTHFFDSLDYYTRKHHGLIGLVSLRFAMVIGSALRTIMWSAASVASPKGRLVAGSKAKLQAWLFCRQATHWRGAGKAAKA